MQEWICNLGILMDFGSGTSEIHRNSIQCCPASQAPSVSSAANIEVLGNLLFVEETVIATAHKSSLISKTRLAGRSEASQKLHQLLIIPPGLFPTIRTYLIQVFLKSGGSHVQIALR
jgi:hypothetical protein